MGSLSRTIHVVLPARPGFECAPVAHDHGAARVWSPSYKGTSLRENSSSEAESLVGTAVADGLCMLKHLRFAAVVLLLFGCASTTEDRGCQVQQTAPICPSQKPNGTIAVDAVAHVRGSFSADGGTVDLDVTTDRPDLVRILDSRVSTDACGAPSVRLKALAEGTAKVRFSAADGATTEVSIRTATARTAKVVPFVESVVKATKTREPKPLDVPDTESELALVSGGKMVWKLTSFDAAGVALVGSGAVTYTLPEGVASTLIESSSDMELFELTASSPASGTFEARTGTARIQIPARVVAPEAIKTLSLFVQDDTEVGTSEKTDAGASKRAQLGVLARAEDANGKALYGAPFRFVLGAETAPSGDQILLYDFDPAAPPRSLVVTVPGSEAKAEASLRVASPAELSRVGGRDLANCSFGSGAAGASSFFSSLALVLVVLRRRRAR